MDTPSPVTRTVWALADVLAGHWRVNPPGGKCSCGHEVPPGARFTEHQVRVLLESEAGQRMLARAQLAAEADRLAARVAERERDRLRATVARVEALADEGDYHWIVTDGPEGEYVQEGSPCVSVDDLRAALGETP